MENRRFIALGDLIADCYYNDSKLLGIDGGSTRFNVIANLSQMNCKNAIIGGCGNDKIGKHILKRFNEIRVDTSNVFFRDRETRVYHLIVNKDMLPKVTYKCSKDSPIYGKSTWYDDDINDIHYFISKVKQNDVIVLDMLNELSLKIIEEFNCDKVLDIGNYSRLSKLQDDQIFTLKSKLEIIQLNERVVPYLMERYNLNKISDIYKLFQPKLMIITHSKDGADFIFEDTEYRKKLLHSTEEIDATGAGDAFLSVFIRKYYDNNKDIDEQFIDTTFEEAISLTSEVVKYVGSRGHIYARLRDSSHKYNPRTDYQGSEPDL